MQCVCGINAQEHKNTEYVKLNELEMLGIIIIIVGTREKQLDSNVGDNNRAPHIDDTLVQAETIIVAGCFDV